MTKQTVLFTLLLCLTWGGCSYNKLPKGFPEEEEFARILADVHFAEATVSQLRMKDRGMDTTVNNYYHYVLDKHALTQEKFDTIVSWYVAHPDIYQDVYDRVIALLSEQEVARERDVVLLEEDKERIRKEKEARNVWKGDKKYFISTVDTFDRRIAFDIEVDTIEAQGYRFSAFYQFLKESMVRNPVLEVIALYADSTLDTLSYDLPATHINTKAEMMIGFDKELKILRMEGFLVKHDTMDEIRARINNIEFEYTPLPDSIQ